MIFDTSFLIDLMNRQEYAIKRLEQLQKMNSSNFITVIAIFELWSGAVRSQKPEKEKQKILNILESLPILSLDQKSSKIAGEIHGQLLQKGMSIDPEDCMIAGIAKNYNQSILTRDKHFQRIKNIVVETY